MQRCLEFNGNDEAAYLLMSRVLLVEQDDASGLPLLAALKFLPEPRNVNQGILWRTNSMLANEIELHFRDEHGLRQ